MLHVDPPILFAAAVTGIAAAWFTAGYAWACIAHGVQRRRRRARRRAHIAAAQTTIVDILAVADDKRYRQGRATVPTAPPAA